MSSLSYVGKAPSVSTDITNRAATTTILQAATPNQSSVQAQITALVTSTYATKTYVDSLNATFALPSYYVAQDLLNVPNAVNGTAGGTQLGSSGYYGVASLDSGAHIPVAQIPALGAGYLTGPYGTTAQAGGSTGTTPMKIADFAPTTLRPANVQFKPLVYMTALVNGVMAKPIIDVFITNSTTAPTGYSTAGTLIARGEGRSLWNDYAALDIIPVPDTTGETPVLYPATYNVWVTAWLYDAESYNSTATASVSIQSGGIPSAALYLLRGAQ
jgi:hypothetical protein